MTLQPHGPVWRVMGVFLLVALALQLAWALASGTAAERVVIDDWTVATAAGWVSALVPDLGVVAQGAWLRTPWGGIHVLHGCEGSELLTLLVAALLASPLHWRQRGVALVLGLLWVFALNQARLLALLWALRWHRAWFGQVHGLLGPLVLMACTLAYVQWWLRRTQATRAAAAPHAPR